MNKTRKIHGIVITKLNTDLRYSWLSESLTILSIITSFPDILAIFWLPLYRNVTRSEVRPSASTELLKRISLSFELFGNCLG